MTMTIKRSVSQTSSLYPSYGCHCPCHSDRQQSALSAFSVPFSNIVPAHFKVGHHGTTTIKWSRYNTPKSKSAEKLVKSRDSGISGIHNSRDSTGRSRPTGHSRSRESRTRSVGPRSVSETRPRRRGHSTPGIVGNRRMGKTVTETATRIYTKDGKRFEETVTTVTTEDEAGNVSKSTKTLTKQISSSTFETHEMSKALGDVDCKYPNMFEIDKNSLFHKVWHHGGAFSNNHDSDPNFWFPEFNAKTKTTKGATRKTSSSSRDSSPDRKGAKTKSNTNNKPSGSGGIFGKILPMTGRKSSDSDSSDEEDFIDDVIKGVNQYRRKHGVKTLKVNKEMNRYAKEWAKKLAEIEKMAHRPDNKYGENVFCISSSTKAFKIKGSEVVDRWYSEIKNHTFGEEPKDSVLKSGHFTQLIWKDTKLMGVGKARSASGTKIFVVANFDPQGNWMGQFASQVPPVGGFSKIPPNVKPAIEPKSRTSSTSSSSSSSSSGSSSSDEEDFSEDCLKAHNNYRKKHGVPPLKLNKKLSMFAQEWAEVIAKKNVLQHRDNNDYGENIYCAWSSNPNHKIKGDEAVESWYSEIKDYTFGREPADLRAGHFTQVVWQDSKELGIGIARSSTGKLFVVANYDPAGNVVGSYATKVPKPK